VKKTLLLLVGFDDVIVEQVDEVLVLGVVPGVVVGVVLPLRVYLLLALYQGLHSLLVPPLAGQDQGRPGEAIVLVGVGPVQGQQHVQDLVLTQLSRQQQDPLLIDDVLYVDYFREQVLGQPHVAALHAGQDQQLLTLVRSA
jgi:hypothetical protein